MSLVTLVL